MFNSKVFVTAAFTLAASVNVMAADALHNTKWKTIDDEDGKAKAVVLITEKNGKLSGKIVDGFTADAKKLKGEAVLKNVKASAKGVYKGKITDPSNRFIPWVSVDAKLVGNKLTLKAIGRTQTWVKIK